VGDDAPRTTYIKRLGARLGVFLLLAGAAMSNEPVTLAEKMDVAM